MNFFKNAVVYRLTRPEMLLMVNIEEALQNLKFTPCGSQDMSRAGWVSPTDQHTTMTHTANGQMLLTMQREDKIIPATVIRKATETRIAKLEADQGRKLKKTEKDSLKDEVLHTLLPRAFSKFSTVRLWIDMASALIIVDTASARQAENALALLRKSLGSLPVVPLTIEKPIELTITDWVRSGSAPDGFALQDEAELKAVLADGGQARVKKQDLASDEILTHIEAGKLITRLALDWQQRVTFSLSDSFVLRRLKYADELTQQNDDIDREDIMARFDADFTLMTGEISDLVKQLVEALGGEAAR